MYTGQITKWNDPRFQALNPGIPLPDQNITFVVRLDGSGTSDIFSTYLSQLSPIFNATVGTSTLPNWSGTAPVVSCRPLPPLPFPLHSFTRELNDV